MCVAGSLPHILNSLNQWYRITSLKSRLSSLESTNADQTTQLISAQSQLSTAQTQLARHDGEVARRAERDKTELQAEVGTLKHKLATYADYDEIKRELEIMKVSLYTPPHINVKRDPHALLIVR